jgi:hypothetical protein
MTSQEVNDERVPARAAHTLKQLEAMGLGSRAFLYNQIADGLLRAIKLGGKTIVLEEDRREWLANRPKANIAKPKKKPDAGDATRELQLFMEFRAAHGRDPSPDEAMAIFCQPTPRKKRAAA